MPMLMSPQANSPQSSMDAYLAELRTRLRALPEEQITDIVEEIRSHIRDSAGSGGVMTEAGIHTALSRLGAVGTRVITATKADTVANLQALAAILKEKGYQISVATNGKQALDVNGVKALAAIPSLGELRSTFLGVLLAPGSKFARQLNAPAQSLARVLQAYKEKQEAA